MTQPSLVGATVEKTLRDIKIDGAVELIMQRVAGQIHESRRNPKFDYPECDIRSILGEPGDTPKNIDMKFKRILPLLGGLSRACAHSPALIDGPFIAALEKDLKKTLR